MKKEIICYCMNITKKEILQAIKSGAQTLESIKKSTRACTGNKCMDMHPEKRCCSSDIKRILQEEVNRND